jgi:probable rRNA maturation factor
MITFFVEEISFKLKDKLKTRNWIKQVAQLHNHVIGDLNYIFCDDEYLLNINKTYLNHDFYTDIITFDQSEEDKKIEGEIYISVERVAENALSNKVSFENELKRVIIHGLLHLVGFQDKTTAQQKLMRHKEDEMLNLLN